MAKIKLVDSADGAEQSQVVVLDDGTEIGLSELDGGYMRQSDYTKKTQELANERKALETQSTNHQVTEVINSQAHENPDLANMTQMYLDMQMTNLSQKYGESFDEVAVLKEAGEQLKNGTSAANINFDKIHKAMAYQDTNSLEAQMRAKIMKELEENSIDTSSIISGGDGTMAKTNTLGLTAQEKAYCDKVGSTYEDYAKYK